jgi:NarL family two-component system response regulator LiaR
MTSQDTQQITVLIVDDHAVVRQGLRLLLDAQPGITVVGEAADGPMAIQMTRQLEPTVILMDLLMPGMNGIDTMHRLRELEIDCKVLVLTSSLEDQLVKQALQAGAHGYVLKASRAMELVQAIERVAQGISALDPAAAQVLMHQVQTHDPLETLTTREREVFDVMARGMNNTEIAEHLIVSEATVRTHIANILDKLALRDRTQVTIYALKRGLIRVEDLP